MNIVTWGWYEWILYGGLALIFVAFVTAIVTDIVLAGLGKKEHTSFFTTVFLWVIFTVGWYFGIGKLLTLIF